MTTSPLPNTADARIDKSNHYFAYGLYAFIFFAFVSVCAIAIIVTSQQEAKHTGFKAITTKTPMSFLDNTYVKKDDAN